MQPTCLIVEDEPVAARKLARMANTEGLSVIEMTDSIAATIRFFQNNPEPDLMFLDIELGDGQSFEIFESVSPKCPIIFTTAYDDYAIKAFKLNSLDYLLKPIKQAELHSALEKFKQQKNPVDLQKIKELFTPKTDSKSHFLIKLGQRLFSIPTHQISAFYIEDKTTLLEAYGKTYPLDQSIEELMDEISAKDFFRISRSAVIARKHIQEIVIYSGSRLKVTLNNSSTPYIVSRNRVNDFKIWLGG